MQPIDDQVISRFNLFRENVLGKEFKRGEMKKQLKDKMAFPASDQFLMAITYGVNPPIIKVKRGTYAVNPRPVYRERLQTVFDEYKNTIKTESTRNKNISVEEAIIVLKKAGYRILKPETKWIELLAKCSYLLLFMAHAVRENSMCIYLVIFNAAHPQ